MDAARERLELLFNKYPAYPPLLRRYAEALLELRETWHAAAVARQWTEIQPQSVLAWQRALECYLSNFLIILAQEAAQQLYSLGEEVPLELLEINENKILDKGPFDQVEWETLRRHELGLLWLHGNDFQKAVECLAEEQFPPSRNNYATALFHLGRIREALAVFFQLWQETPSNLYALQWALQLRLFLGERLEAEGLTTPLRTTPPQRAEDALAQLSGLLLLDENQAALDSYEQFTKLKWYSEEHFNPARLYHLAAVAAARLKKKKHAQSLWKKALKADPDFDLAEENLNNLKLPQEQARPLWAWPHYQWFPQTFEQQLRQISRLQDNETAMRKFAATADTLGVHNHYLGLVCRQGDGVAYHLAQMILLQRLGGGDQKALEELKLLLTQEAGTDENRYQLAQTLISGGHLPAEQPLPLRIKGEVRDIRLFSFSVDDEPHPSGLPKKALGKLEQALDAIY